jgi:uncharacterized protein YndB with AHSA1/START domain
MTVAVQNILVRKNIVVQAPRAHVFKTFTERIDTWWPRDHHIGGKDPYVAIIEPRAGGRWFERAHDGTECNWGKVVAWEPTERLLLTWDINGEWKYQEGFGSEVEVRFVSEGPETTRVTLEHRKLEQYGDQAEAMRAMFDGPGAWVDTLALMAKAAEKR